MQNVLFALNFLKYARQETINNLDVQYACGSALLFDIKEQVLHVIRRSCSAPFLKVMRHQG